MKNRITAEAGQRCFAHRTEPGPARATGEVRRMTQSQADGWTPSSRFNPCPVCGRDKDGDCRMSDALVLCHRGATFHPPDVRRRGDVVPGADGRQWAYTGDSSDGRQRVFKPHQARPGASASRKPAAAAPSEPGPAAITLARLPQPGPVPPAHLSDGQRINYSADPEQWVSVKVEPHGEKKHYPWHIGDNGKPKCGKGHDPWPLWREADALKHGSGQWVTEAEGEKCAAWLMAGCAVAISQPGHAHTAGAIKCRYSRLQDAGVVGVVYVADNDITGEKKAQRCAAAAAAAGLQFLIVRAIEVWPGIPAGGSIDDAPGTPAERLRALEAAIPAAVKRQEAERQRSDDKDDETETRPPTYLELLQGCLAAIQDGDVDEEMRQRAAIIGVYRRNDAQVTAALFRLLTEQETGMPAGSIPESESLDLDLIEGMDPLIDGFIPANDLTLIYGSKGAGKTAAGLAVSFAVADGTGLLDHDKPAEAGPALFIASDSGAAPLVSAMQDMGLMDHPGVKKGADQSFYVWSHDAGQRMTAWCADVPGVVRLLKFVREKRVRLVVIDSAKAICSKAGINYLDNDSVSALLTFLKEVICPHAAVVILNHDGTEKGAHAGAKAWAEIPSMVHNIMQITDAPEERLWRVVKNRMGGLREFRYRIGDDGRLEIVQGVERIGDAGKAILQILQEALERGIGTVSSRELAQEIDQRFGLARKTTANSLTRMTRGKNPEIVRAGHGRYRLAPRLADRLRARMTSLSVSRELTPSDSSQEQGFEKFPTPRELREHQPETDCGTADLSETLKVPISDQPGTSQPETVAGEVPEGTCGNIGRELSDPSDASGSGTEVPEVPAFSGIPRVRARETAPPPADLLPHLRAIRQQQPQAIAAVLVNDLYAVTGTRSSGRQMKAWLAWIDANPDAA